MVVDNSTSFRKLTNAARSHKLASANMKIRPSAVWEPLSKMDREPIVMNFTNADTSKEDRMG